MRLFTTLNTWQRTHQRSSWRRRGQAPDIHPPFCPGIRWMMIKLAAATGRVCHWWMKIGIAVTGAIAICLMIMPITMIDMDHWSIARCIDYATSDCMNILDRQTPDWSDPDGRPFPIKPTKDENPLSLNLICKSVLKVDESLLLTPV